MLTVKCSAQQSFCGTDLVVYRSAIKYLVPPSTLSVHSIKKEQGDYITLAVNHSFYIKRMLRSPTKRARSQNPQTKLIHIYRNHAATGFLIKGIIASISLHYKLVYYIFLVLSCRQT